MKKLMAGALVLAAAAGAAPVEISWSVMHPSMSSRVFKEKLKKGRRMAKNHPCSVNF